MVTNYTHMPRSGGWKILRLALFLANVPSAAEEPLYLLSVAAMERGPWEQGKVGAGQGLQLAGGTVTLGGWRAL